MAIDRAKKPEEVDVEELISELEHKVERIKILYEQYFMGIEKMEPQTARKEISRKMIEITQMNIRNSALRFRFNALHQKFGVYSTYWSRTLRAIENGTYFRSVARAGREAVRRGVDVPDEILRTMPARLRDRILRDRERLAGGAAKPDAAASTPPVTVSTPRPAERPEDNFDSTFDALFDSMSSKPPTKPPAPAPLPPGMDEAKMRDLYQRYTQARRALGQKELRYEQLVATVQKTAPPILEQHRAREVDFAVVVKDGKVILKATPKR